VAQSETSTFDRIAAPYDRGMVALEKLWLRQMRTRLLPEAEGKVLEVGVGTGANFPFYSPSVCLTAIDESTDMLVVASGRASALGRPVSLGKANVEHLAFPDACFDAVVATLVLCSVVDQHRALDELRRVLHRPGGRLLLLEHTRPQVQPLASLADLVNIPWYAFNKRCHLNRETQQAVIQAGFQVERVESKLGGLLRMIVAHTV
jgi:ubiquinone/menaquinone biosynthesis C-methylase UbiE